MTRTLISAPLFSLLGALFVLAACSSDSGAVAGGAGNSATGGGGGAPGTAGGGSGPAATGGGQTNAGGTLGAITAGSSGSAIGGGVGQAGGGASPIAGGGAGGAATSVAGASGAGGSSSGSSAGASSAGGAPVYSTDPSTFGGQPRCQGFDVCESFESTAPGSLPTGFTLQGYGTRQVGVSTERAMRGARSLALNIAGGQGAVTAWLTRSSLGSLGAQHFGRAFYRIESPAPSEFVHFDLVEGSGPYGGHTNMVRYASTGTGVGKMSANWSFIYNVQPSGNGAGAEFGSEGNRSAHPRVDDWMCLEWSFDSTKQVAQYYLDGAAIDYLKIDTERAEIPVFSTLAVGFAKYQNTGAFLVYMDELALDAERIGCNN